MTDVNTRNGVFGPSGDGGGIFDYTNALSGPAAPDSPGMITGLGRGGGGGGGRGGGGGGGRGGGGGGFRGGGGGRGGGGFRGGGGGFRHGGGHGGGWHGHRPHGFGRRGGRRVGDWWYGGGGGWWPGYAVIEDYSSDFCDTINARRLRGDVPPDKEREYMLLCGPAVAGLGATTPHEEIDDCYVVEGATSNVIGRMQVEINKVLATEGYEPIPITKTWDAKTCGAIFVLGGKFDAAVSPCGHDWNIPARCKASVPPKKKDEQKKDYTGLTMGMIGGIGILAAVAIAVTAKGG